MATSQLPYQVKAPFLSLRKRFLFFYHQQFQSCGCTITALLIISIKANQGAPLWSCMLISTLMNPILAWFCRQLCDCIDQVNLRCYSVGGGRHGLICLSDVHGEKMSLQLQSGEAGWNRQRRAVTGPSASVVGPGSAFFLCQTVFWHRPYPHILPTEHGHGVWHSFKVSHRVEKSSLMLIQSPNFWPRPSVLL